MASFMSDLRKQASAYHYISDEAMGEETATRLFDYVETFTSHGEMYKAIKGFRKDYLSKHNKKLSIDEAYSLMKAETIKDLVSMHSYTN